MEHIECPTTPNKKRKNDDPYTPIADISTPTNKIKTILPKQLFKNDKLKPVFITKVNNQHWGWAACIISEDCNQKVITKILQLHFSILITKFFSSKQHSQDNGSVQNVKQNQMKKNSNGV